MATDHPSGARERLDRGAGEALRGNTTAFGYSVMITASFAAVQYERGQPSYTDLLYGMGAVVAFTALEALVSRGFRVPLEGGSDQVIALGTALAFVSVALAITTALGVAAALRGGAAWFGAALSASLVFIPTESLEFILAEWMQDRRGEPTEQS